MNYKIVTASSVGELEEKIAEYIRKGWIPQGGVASWINLDRRSYGQAMIWKEWREK